MPERLTPTRERIIAAASKLFYGQGIRAVSMDGVAQQAGVTKKTLYYHFRSKDDLISAYLEARDAPNLAVFQRWFDEADTDYAGKVRNIFTQLSKSAAHPKWKGCGFLRTSVELFDLPGHPAVAAGRVHKKRVENWLCGVFEEVGDWKDPRQLARQIILLLDGAFAVVLLHRDPCYMDVAGDAAAKLIEGCARSG